MRLNVYNKEGELCKFDVEDNITIEKLKFMALGHFGANLEDAIERQRASTRFKLLHTTQYRPLDDKKTLQQEDLHDRDELVLNKKPPIFLEDKKDFQLGPSLAEIMVATSALPQKYPPSLQDSKPWGLDFQTEIRRVLITLIQTSHRLLCLDPLASQMFQHFHEKLQPPTQTPPVNQEAISRLVEMGFSEQRAIKALLLNRMNPSQAADWLLEHEADPEVDAPLSSNPTDHHQRRISETRDSLISSLVASTSGGDDEPASVLSMQNTTPESVIKAFRAFKKSQFTPNSQAISNLKEMGFEQSDIEEALAVCGNSEDAACEWLLQDQNRTRINKPSSKLINLNKSLATKEEFQGLIPDSQVSKALLTDPTILLGLNNPKMFLVLLNMYEAFIATNALHLGQWFNDPDAAIFLSQIFRIYHAEKYGNAPPSSVISPTPCPITVGLPPGDDMPLPIGHHPRRFSSSLTGGVGDDPEASLPVFTLPSSSGAALASASYPSALNSLEGGGRGVGTVYRPYHTYQNTLPSRYRSSRVVGDGLYRDPYPPSTSSSSTLGSANSLYRRRGPLDGSGSDRY